MFTLMIPAAPKPCTTRAMVSSATLAIAPSITAIIRPSAMVSMAQWRCGTGRPSAVSVMAAGISLWDWMSISARTSPALTLVPLSKYHFFK